MEDVLQASSSGAEVKEWKKGMTYQEYIYTLKIYAEDRGLEHVLDKANLTFIRGLCSGPGVLLSLVIRIIFIDLEVRYYAYSYIYTVCCAHTVCTLARSVCCCIPPQKFPEFWVALLTSLRTYLRLYDGGCYFCHLDLR